VVKSAIQLDAVECMFSLALSDAGRAMLSTDTAALEALHAIAGAPDNSQPVTHRGYPL
jgi:hypothetical protein